jgi:hypothetical protein
MTAISRRLCVLEARSTRTAPICLFLLDPDEPIASAWARVRPGEPLDLDVELMLFSWMRPGEHDGGEAR